MSRTWFVTLTAESHTYTFAIVIEAFLSASAAAGPQASFGSVRTGSSPQDPSAAAPLTNAGATRKWHAHSVYIA